MDYCLFSASSIEEAMVLMRDVAEVLEWGCFRLIKSLSNKEDVILTIYEKDHAKSLTVSSFGGVITERLLGVE